jgi:hypothetical protein
MATRLETHRQPGEGKNSATSQRNAFCRERGWVRLNRRDPDSVYHGCDPGYSPRSDLCLLAFGDRASRTRQDDPVIMHRDQDAMSAEQRVEREFLGDVLADAARNEVTFNDDVVAKPANAVQASDRVRRGPFLMRRLDCPFEYQPSVPCDRPDLLQRHEGVSFKSGKRGLNQIRIG